MAESSYMIAPGETADSVSMKRKLALALAQKNLQPLQVDHWAQGLAHLGDQAYSGYEMGKLDRDEKAETAKGNALLAQILGGGGASPSPSPVSSSAAPMGQDVASAMPAASDASLPRGYRNMNPGNIEDGPFARSQPGYSGSDGRFAKFAAMENGTGAMDALLSSYDKRGINTPASIVNRWAPASDGNNVSAYAQNIAKQLGIDPNMPVPPEKRQALIAAMAQHENGQPLPQGPQQMAQAQPQGGPPRELMIQMLGNRKTAPLARGIIQKQIEQKFSPKDTDEIREYNLYKQQSGKKSFFDYKADLKRAGGTQVTVDNKQESEYEKITGKQFAEMNAEIPKNAIAARGKIAKIDRMAQLLSDPNIYTGAAGESVLELKRLGKVFGIDVGDLGGAEAVRAISNEFALELRNPSGGAGMPGAMSDKDREFLQTIPPGLGKTPEGNAQMADYLKRIAKRSLDVERLRQQYVKKNGRLNEGFYSVLSDFSDANQIFPEGNNTTPSAADAKVRKFNPATGKIE